MQVVTIIISIILALVCIALIGIVLMQEGKSAGLSGAISGMADSYFGKNKARTLEGRLERITKILAAVFIVLSFVLYLMAA
jgi:preprotein translocase subunit SecG